MSDDTLNPVAQANALVATYNSDGNVTTLMEGFAAILSASDITTNQAIEVVAVLTSTISTITTLSSQFSLNDYTTTTYWSSDITQKFLTAFTAIFTGNTNLTSYDITSATLTIGKYLNLVTTFSDDSYYNSNEGNPTGLLVEIQNILTDVEYASISNLCLATYTMYKNLNTSNHLSIMCSYDVAYNSFKAIGAYVVPIIISTKMDITPLLTALPNILIGNAVDINNGMSRIEFIKACEGMLALFSPYLTTDPNIDKMTPLKTLMGGYIISNFVNSTTYSTSMYLSSAETLSTSVSTYFGVGAIPITPLKATQFVGELNTVYASYDFTENQKGAIQAAINGYFSTNEINYTVSGLSPSQVNSYWTWFSGYIIAALNAGSIDADNQYLATFKTTYTNLVISYVTSSISDVLSASAFFDSGSASVIQVVNPSTLTLDVAGLYLSDWQDTFITNITSNIGGTIAANVLRMGISDMMEASSNKTSLNYYSVTGNSFIQIGIEILLFLQTLNLTTMGQAQLDIVGKDLTNFLITILNVYTLIPATNAAAAAAAAAATLVPTAITLAPFTLGLSLLLLTGLSYETYTLAEGVTPDTSAVAALVGDENVPVYIGVLTFLTTANLLTTT